MSWASATAYALPVVGLLALGVGPGDASSVCYVPTVPLVDNFRDVQPLNPATRTIYRSSDASATCSAECTDDSSTCEGDGNSKKFPLRVWDTTLDRSWSYGDQEHWSDYTNGGQWVNECNAKNYEGTHPGESPINFDPADVTETSEPTITLSDEFSTDRSGIPGLQFVNNGHSVTMTVCGNNRVDCSATANFGAWPKTLRDITDDENDDEYFLMQLHFHWGSDRTKGSEHTICGDPKSAEMHMVFMNKNSDRMATGRGNAESGLMFAVLGTFIEGGADEPNEALAPIFDSIALVENMRTQALNPSFFMTGTVNLMDLLPEDYDTKFYTYAGSLTTPPCLQQVTWYVFENVIRVTDDQLEQLRRAQTPAKGIQIVHGGFKAVLFPFVAIIIGTAMSWILSRYAPNVPYTVSVLAMGIIFSATLNHFNPPCWTGPPSNCNMNSLQRSTNMWAKIDGHVLLYTFLPSLLFGDSMALNFHTFKRTFWQCLLLACPGVLLGTFLTGWAAKAILPFDWDMNLCYCVGAILSATDPVAVVAMLKSLGASPNLTMQITGESLMNDGTAIVVFNIFWAMYNRNHEYRYESFGAMVKYFCRLSIAGPLLGIAIGYVALFGMQLCTRKHEKGDITIQTSITLCTAYLSFFMGEYESRCSGVLCCVASAIVLAKHAWPFVNSHEALENVWHALEYFGNTVLFFLAGVITQRAVVGFNDLSGTQAQVNFQTKDYVFVIFFFAVMMAIRAGIVLVAYPALKVLGTGTNPKDAAFIVWAGLRGAVGLSLSLLVYQSGGDQRAGLQVVFTVSGLALLTLLVNGITCGPVLEAWGMLGDSESKQLIMDEVHKRVEENSVMEYHKACIEQKHDAEEAIEYLTRLRHLKGTDMATPMACAAEPMEGHAAGLSEVHTTYFTAEMLDQYEQELRDADEFNVKIADLTNMRERFYHIVRAEYWELIEAGHLPRGSAATQVLLNSIDMVLDSSNMAAGGLEECKSDWDFVMDLLDSGCNAIFTKCMGYVLEKADVWLPDSVTIDKELHYMINYQSMECCYHTCASYIHAHQEAQVKIAMMFGGDSTPDTPQEVIIIKESIQKTQLSSRVLDEINPELVKLIKSKIVAEHLLEIEYNFVLKLVTKGVISMKEAEDLFNSIRKDESLISQARKEQALDIAKVQTGVDVGFEDDLETAMSHSRDGHGLPKSPSSTELTIINGDGNLVANNLQEPFLEDDQDGSTNGRSLLDMAWIGFGVASSPRGSPTTSEPPSPDPKSPRASPRRSGRGSPVSGASTLHVALQNARSPKKKGNGDDDPVTVIA